MTEFEYCSNVSGAAPDTAHKMLDTIWRTAGTVCIQRTKIYRMEEIEQQFQAENDCIM